MAHAYIVVRLVHQLALGETGLKLFEFSSGLHVLAHIEVGSSDQEQCIVRPLALGMKGQDLGGFLYGILVVVFSHVMPGLGRGSFLCLLPVLKALPGIVEGVVVGAAAQKKSQDEDNDKSILQRVRLHAQILFVSIPG